MTTDDSRQDPRYRVTDSKLVTASLRQAPTDGKGEIRGELLDLSQKGLRIKVADAPKQGDELHLSLSAADVNFDVKSVATVCWVEPDFREGWIVGCSLKKPLKRRTLDKLAASGALERRNDLRQKISFGAEAKTELSSSFTSVRLVNLSAGGFCAMCDSDIGAKVDERLLLKLANESKSTEGLVKARVAWSSEAMEDGQTIGCTFLTRHDHKLMQSLLDHEPSGNPLFEMVQRQQPTKWAMVAAGAVGLILMVKLFWL